MLFSLDWLSDHVDVSDLEPERIGELFTLHVAEVDAVVEPGGGWPGVTVGLVREVRPHPDADRLRLVKVDTGGGEMEVVCGAPNVAEGQKICYAPEGTTLPGGLVLKRRKIRGVFSSGMVLSRRELGIGDDHEGIFVLDDEAEVGRPVREVLPGGAVLDVDNTAITTRPDLWGHYGAARELAAVLGRDLRPLDLGREPPRGAPQVEVEVATPDLCRRYLGWVIGGIEVGPSPGWLKHRLEQAGQRPINNVVDLTNYILLECGQPLHAFDRRQIAQGRIVVRPAARGEVVTTLDGVARTLPQGCCVIADPERAVAVAGVMGLQNSEVSDDTSEIILEVASFEMTSIRPTAHALGLRTESSIRFEKGLDPEGVPVAARRFLTLLQKVCPGARPLGAPCDVAVPPPEPRTIRLDEDWIERRLGTPIGAERTDEILQRLGFRVRRSQGAMTVTVPSWRSGRDVSLPQDLEEEVGRIHGYDRIDPVPLRGELEPVPEEPERRARRIARRALSHEAGLTEIQSYPFVTEERCRRCAVEPGALAVANAAQSGLDLLTSSLLPNLVHRVAENLKYRDELAVYEIGRVFGKREEGGLPRENERVVIAFAQRGDASPVLDLKGAVEQLCEAFAIQGARLGQEEGPAWLHPGRSARLGRGKELFGWCGELAPRVLRAFDIEAAVAVADLDLDGLRAAQGGAPRMRPVSRFPTVPYDVALLVDRRTPAGEVAAALRKAAPELVREVRLFDVYEGASLPEGKRSLAFTLVFGSMEKTLDTRDVEELRARVRREVDGRGWSLRLGQDPSEEVPYRH